MLSRPEQGPSGPTKPSLAPGQERHSPLPGTPRQKAPPWARDPPLLGTGHPPRANTECWRAGKDRPCGVNGGDTTLKVLWEGISAISPLWPFRPHRLCRGVQLWDPCSRSGESRCSARGERSGCSVLGLQQTVNELTPRELFFIALPH